MNEKEKLYILWTNDNIYTTQHMLMMYATNSRLHGWWKEVTIIVWGATAKLLAENMDVQEKMYAAVHAGVKFTACSACSRVLGVTEALASLGVEIKPWGEELTKLIQNGENLITI